MAFPKLSRLELRVIDVLWSRGPSSVREVQESFPEEGRPAYTTVLTVISRLEAKKAVRRARKISNAYIFEAVVSRRAAQSHMLGDFLRLFGGRMQPLMTHLIDAGELTLEDVRAAEKRLLELKDKGERGDKGKAR
ncbi:MAG TPA: BlaI/MecI/CopY family transcriptional regulator [Caulobacteraceae bacterium]|jgi:predicted transcriptional regulator